LEVIVLKKNKTFIFSVLIIFLLANFFGNTVAYADSFFKNNKVSAYPYHKFVKGNLIKGYQEFISPANQATCPMSPTDSGYALQSFRQYNPVLAWLKTSDRLIRCSNDLENYEVVKVNGMIRYRDPVKYDEVKSNNESILNSNFKPKLTIKKVSEKDESKINAKLLYYFAKELEANKEYEKAIIEYKRLLSYYPNSAYKANTLKAVFNILYQQEKYLEMINWGKKILNNNEKLVNIRKIEFLIGVAYFKIDNFKLARNYFEKVRDFDNNELKDKTYLLEGLSFAKQEKWKQAKNSFSEIKSSSQFYRTAQKSIKLAKQGKHLKYKDPVIASALGIIPGLGYLYSGYSETAVSSIFVNSLFIGGATKAFENDNKSLGMILGTFGFGFYTGNIYGSFQTAQRKNQKIKQEHLLKFDLKFKY
jgi:tetratricopeptide (TPR) repeat protein